MMRVFVAGGNTSAEAVHDAGRYQQCPVRYKYVYCSVTAVDKCTLYTGSIAGF